MIHRTKYLAIVAIALLLTGGGVAQAALITPTGVTASNSYSGAPVGKLIDSSGLDFNTAAGTHDNQGLAATMWMSNGGTVANEWLVFDLGQSYDLTQAYIWQQNQGHAVNAGGARNTRTLDIYVSSDGITYTPTPVGGTRTLGVADGSNPALPAETVSLSASAVQYVKFDILTAGSGNTNEYVGLSEVRFEGTTIPENLVTPTNALSTSYWIADNAHPIHLIDSSGLSASSAAGTHDNHALASTMWIAGNGDGGLGGPIGTPPSVASQEVVFDLGRAYDLTGAYVWNENQVHPSLPTLYQSRGTKDFDVYVSSDTDPLTATWTPMGSKTLDVAGGTAAEPSQWVPFDAGGVQLVKFDIRSAYSGAANEYVGLSEVRFKGVMTTPPPPGGLLLRDEFDANTPNSFNVNVDIARQTGSLAPTLYLQSGGAGSYKHQLQHPNAPDELLMADSGIGGTSGAIAPDFNFNEEYSEGGLLISFDVDPTPSNYPTRDPSDWGAISVGASQADVLAAVNANVEHLGLGFRGNGNLFAFDGSTNLTPSELIYTSSPGPGMKHVEIRLSGLGDDNPFDGVGDTFIEVFGDVNGYSAPVYSYTKFGGYADNYVALQGYGIAAHLDNFEIFQTTAPPPPPPGGLLFQDDFDANTPNTYNVNTDIGRQTGSLAPTQYLQSGGAGSYTHQLQNVNAPDQLLLANGGAIATNFNFNQDYSEGGLLISFDVDPTPSNYPTRDPMDWGAINLGASQADALTSVNAASEHLSLGFRGNGSLFAFDGNTNLTPSELIYTSSPGPGMKHIEILLSGVGDNNPFDGVGDTLIEVFGDVNGFSTPVYSFTKSGGYADNHVGLQGYLIAAHFDNFQIEQLEAVPEPSTFALGFLGLLGLGWYSRRRRR